MTTPSDVALQEQEALISGCEAIAQACRLADVDVITAYPIRPYDTVMQAVARLIANGDLDAEYIVAESEHSQFEIVKHASAVGARVFVPRMDLPPPGEDEYYFADLVGCAVFTPDGGPVGHVSSVVHGPAHDWLEIRGDGKEEALLPFVSEFIREVDMAGRRIVVTPPEGWPHAR